MEIEISKQNGLHMVDIFTDKHLELTFLELVYFQEKLQDLATMTAKYIGVIEKCQ